MTYTGKRAFVVIAAFSFAIHSNGGQSRRPSYSVLPPTAQDNLTIFPIVADAINATNNFLTLDEGLRSGLVVVTEEGSSTGLVRPRSPRAQAPDIWSERVPRVGPYRGAEVNRLVLINHSDRPLLLLAGEIVTGGKQDRVVGKDRIIPAKSEPIDVGVFCVEPHRWVQTSAHFGGAAFAMAQPSVRMKAMAAKDQQGVWNEVAKSRGSLAGVVPAPAVRALQATSSYAVSMENGAVRERVDTLAVPIERSYDKLMRGLRAQKAVGAVVAVNGEIVWVDVFANTSLLEKYWPKLIRSYATEALTARASLRNSTPPSTKEAQAFLDDLSAQHETVESEPGVYRNTEMTGQDFNAFILTSLLPGTGFDVHIAKMRL